MKHIKDMGSVASTRKNRRSFGLYGAAATRSDSEPPPPPLHRLALSQVPCRRVMRAGAAVAAAAGRPSGAART
jgi:hypothetical protein